MADWIPASGSGHPLEALNGTLLEGAAIEVTLGPRNRYGATYFKASLRDPDGSLSQPFLLALHSSGPYPAFNWIEIITLNRSIEFPQRTLTLSDTTVQQLFNRLSSLIPPGGHLMSEYESDGWSEARRGLACGIPPAATPLGSTMFHAGCGIAFKDWHFAEGGIEGPRKLQGYKPLDDSHRRTRAADMRAELSSFIERRPGSGCRDLWEPAIERANNILSQLPSA